MGVDVKGSNDRLRSLAPKDEQPNLINAREGFAEWLTRLRAAIEGLHGELHSELRSLRARGRCPGLHKISAIQNRS